ncbi:MAG: GNAT family protein [Acidimicrobiia bacterium]
MFGLPGSSAPATTTIDEFFLEPLTTDHVELDYAAVMDTREWLREWSGSTWPADDFTVDENREDLARHQREHEEGVAFTFTVLRSDRSECLGCVYLADTDRLAEANPDLIGRLPTGAAVLGLWVRRSHPAPDAVDRLLTGVLDWLGREWEFPAVYLAVRSADERHQAPAARAGLAVEAQVTVPGRNGIFDLYRG